MTSYDWGFADSAEAVYVLKAVDGNMDELFDVALYDPDVIDPNTGIDAQTQSLNDLRTLIGYANAALAAGLDPLPVAGPQN